MGCRGAAVNVVPLVGTWIETAYSNAVFAYGYASFPSWERGLKHAECCRRDARQLSFPSWERGLKLQYHCVTVQRVRVVPLVGTWIETFSIPECTA